MQLKYCFKKEWSQFLRTFRLLVIIIAFFATALSYPALFGFTNAVLQNFDDFSADGSEQTLSVSFDGSQAPENSESPQNPEDILGGMGMGDMLELYSDARAMFAVTATMTASTGTLIAMLLLMSAAGGEQKKRAMIVPMCSGLTYKNYLIPKFVIYPLSLFSVTFLSVAAAGFLCNAIFPNNHISFGMIMLVALIGAVYVTFLTTIHLSLGLCTSRPGIMAASVYVGASIIESLLQGFGLFRFHPFALNTLISEIGMNPEFSVADETLNIAVSIAIAVVICVVMFFLALGVLSAKKINNREEVKPEF